VNAAVVFDLGKVLVDFDDNIAVTRIAARSTLPPAEVKRLFYHSYLLVDYESGRLTRQDFFKEVRKVAGFRGTIGEFGEFFADIFTPISPMIELHAGLRQRGVPTYLFSNTNDLAVEYIRRKFSFFRDFDGYIFSYEVKAMKPDAKIYEALEKLAGRRGADILYIDDCPENVAAGAARGWGTILHETPGKSRAAMEKLGLLKRA
jgi:FMN phosphatase YigB (HAD superfamily)